MTSDLLSRWPSHLLVSLALHIRGRTGTLEPGREVEKGERVNGYLLRPLLVCLLFFGMVYAQTKPQISVSPARVKTGTPVMLTGTGFTPNRLVMSHLRRPDGSEYNPVRFRIDEHGEFSHKIDTVMMDDGTFELWAEDEASNAVSNRIQFRVESDFTK